MLCVEGTRYRPGFARGHSLNSCLRKYEYAGLGRSKVDIVYGVWGKVTIVYGVWGKVAIVYGV